MRWREALVRRLRRRTRRPAPKLARWRAACMARLMNRLHAVVFHRGDGGVGGAALGGDALAQHLGRLVRRAGQLRRAHKGAHRQLVRLRGLRPIRCRRWSWPPERRTHRPGRSPTGRSRRPVALRRPPTGFARGGDHAFHATRRSADTHGGAGKQRRHALAHQRRRVGHAAHDALAAQPLRNAVAADAGRHAQVQRWACMGAPCAAASLKVWGLTAQTTRPARASAGRPGLRR
jgi:hypothetical protein